MIKRKPVKPPEGAKLPDTPDMVAWRKEFEEMDIDTHLKKLKELGLDDEDLEDFKESSQEVLPKQKKVKKLTKKLTKK
jgi:hypothetical protein